MIELIASSDEEIKKAKTVIFGVDWVHTPKSLVFVISYLRRIEINFVDIHVEILDEEKSKSFLGSAGFGLLGAAALGPLGLIAGALAGGNKQTAVFGVTFNSQEEKTVKFVLKSNSKSEIKILKELAFAKLAS